MAARYAALQPAQCWREGQANGDDAPRGESDKLAAEVRKSHFEEIHQPFTLQQAQQQAARCLTCGEHSICEWTCPLHNHIPQWIELVKAGISPPRSRFPIRPTACRRSLAASVPRPAV